MQAKCISLEDIRAKIEKAKQRRFHRDTESIQGEIADNSADLKMLGEKERSCLLQLGKLQGEQKELQAALKETEEYREYLIAGGDDPDKICLEVMDQITLIEKSLQSSQADLSALQRDKIETERKIDRLRQEKDKLGLLKEPAPPEKTCMFDPTISMSKYIQPIAYEHLPSCSQDIKTLFKDVELFPQKLSAFSNDQAARGLMMQQIGARSKIFCCDKFLDLNESEQIVVQKCLNALRSMSKTFETGVIDSLSGSIKPYRKDNWSQYLEDANRQLQNYFSPTEDNAPKIPRFGVVAPAPVAAPALAVARPQLKMQMATEPVAPSQGKILVKQIEGSGVLSKTKGLRIAIVAGQADKNEPTRVFLEGAFGFKRVKWYDKNGGELLESIKNGGIDLLIAIPDWHSGFMQYVRFAGEKGIATLIVEGHNKIMICQQIARKYGVEIVLPA